MEFKCLVKSRDIAAVELMGLATVVSINNTTHSYMADVLIITWQMLE
jgi:hypothetical protein